MTAATDPRTSTTSPEAIVDVAIGFMAAKQLFAASRIGLFSALGDGPLTAEELASATGTPAAQVRILADSMAAQHLLTRTDGNYALTPDSAAYLTGPRAELDLAPFLAFLGSISYDQWQGYDHTVDTNDAGTLALDDAGWADFMAGVMTYNELHARMFVRHFDVSEFSRVLDFGGLSPAFAVQAMTANPQLTTHFVVAPDFSDEVRQAVEAAGLGGRATIEAQATATASVAGSYDLVMLNHVAHRFTEAENLDIIRSARAAAAPGATLVMLDFYLDDDAAQRKIDALHAGEYYNIDGTVVYPQATVEQWFLDAGWEPVERIDLPGSPRLLVARTR
ncbi:methyltransferase family protein [Arthrobacter ginkgonis]|uniref:methyltransferase family protein n=1 Tax=Arthrobacter ginkgonis TaxID=1630594 RepID=UPI0031EE3719